TDRWNDKPAMYDAFIAEVFDLRVRWHKLIQKGRFPDFITELKALFTEVPVTRAVTKFAESRGAARRNGSLFVEKATGSLGVASSPGMVQGTLKVKDHAFHGE